jgi:hypothetical protein
MPRREPGRDITYAVDSAASFLCKHVLHEGGNRRKILLELRDVRGNNLRVDLQLLLLTLGVQHARLHSKIYTNIYV